MKKLAKYLAVSGVLVGLGVGTGWAGAEEQKARDQKTAAKTEIDLRAEIASPITGEFASGAQMSWGTQPEVGGHHGSGFLSPTGQPSDLPSGTPGNPGPSY